MLTRAHGCRHLYTRAQQNCKEGCERVQPCGLHDPRCISRTISKAPRRLAGWRCPPLHTTEPTQAADTHLQRTGRVAWACPPTFQRFPHSLQTTKVVMGSSELRVCTYGEVW